MRLQAQLSKQIPKISTSKQQHHMNLVSFVAVDCCWVKQRANDDLSCSYDAENEPNNPPERNDPKVRTEYVRGTREANTVPNSTESYSSLSGIRAAYYTDACSIY